MRKIYSLFLRHIMSFVIHKLIKKTEYIGIANKLNLYKTKLSGLTISNNVIFYKLYI